MAQRKQISTRTRFEIFKRDRFTCQYCGDQPPQAVLHVDHIIPVAGGGDNEPSNLTTSCSRCNLGKSDVPLDSVPPTLEQQAAESAERRAQVEALAALMQDERDAVEEWCWEIAELLKPGASKGYNRKNFASIKMFVGRLGYPGALEAAHVAADTGLYEGKTFKYFCGVCWRMIREREDQGS